MLFVLYLAGFVSAQQFGQFGGTGFGGTGGGHNYGNQGVHPQTGGYSSGKNAFFSFGQNPMGQQMQGLGQNQGQPNHQNVGTAPKTQGGSSGTGLFNFPAGNQHQGVSNRLDMGNVGRAPLDTGGSSQGVGVFAFPGAAQRGQSDNVNMVNLGKGPTDTGNSPNSGEFPWDKGLGQANQGGAMGAPQRRPGSNNAFAAETAFGAGGNSQSGGPAFNGGQIGDNAGAGAPLGGALLTDRDQQNAGKSDYSKGAASMSTTVVGVVIAVLVLVGVVAVAAVFLVKQRASRMMVASV